MNLNATSIQCIQKKFNRPHISNSNILRQATCITRYINQSVTNLISNNHCRNACYVFFWNVATFISHMNHEGKHYIVLMNHIWISCKFYMKQKKFHLTIKTNSNSFLLNTFLKYWRYKHQNMSAMNQCSYCILEINIRTCFRWISLFCDISQDMSVLNQIILATEHVGDDWCSYCILAINIKTYRR